MKKLLVPFLALALVATIAGCRKTPGLTTPNAYMNVTVGEYIFSTNTVYPATLNQQYLDTTETLYIIGEQTDTKQKITLTITSYHGKEGVYSIAGGQAGAVYAEATGNKVAIGGLVAITKFTSDCIVGYFNFTTDSLAFTNGTFTVPTPGYVAQP